MWHDIIKDPTIADAIIDRLVFNLHRIEKGQFPTEWQEVVHHDNASGEKHIADVKTANDWIIEFQHSYLNPEERRARESFYPKIVWVVDGLRRKRDKSQVQEALNNNEVIWKEPLILRVRAPESCRLLVEWHHSTVPVFFDFHDPTASADTKLWLLFPGKSTTGTYLSLFSRSEFIKMHHDTRFETIANERILPVPEALAAREKKLQNEKVRIQQINTNRVYNRHTTRRRATKRQF